MTTDAFGFDLHDGTGIICCDCFRKALEQVEHPHLLLSVTKPSETFDGNRICPQCGLPFSRKAVEDSADIILKMMNE